jgi:ABC-type transport system substrate-binding protein
VGRRALLSCVLAGLLGAGSAVGSAAEHSRGASPWTLRIAQTGATAAAAIASIDPAQAAGFFANQLLWSTCAFLYDYADAPTPTGGVVRPEVATAFPTLRRRGRNYTYTIRVRSGFRYQNGTPVTAADFVHAIRRDLDPGLSATGPSVLHDLVRATSRADSIAITLDRPAPDLPTMLSSTLFCAIPSGLPATPTQTAPMAGPYYIATYSPAEIVLKRNPSAGQRSSLFASMSSSHRLRTTQPP